MYKLLIILGMAKGLFNTGTKTRVAIKTVKDPTDKSQQTALLCEIKILSNLESHLNLVNMMGSCTSDFVSTREIYLLLEFCDHGNNYNYRVLELYRKYVR